MAMDREKIVKRSEIVWPHGAGTFPRIALSKMEKYQPGKPIPDHWRVEIVETDGAAGRVTSFDSWKEVDARMTTLYGPSWHRTYRRL